MGTVARKESISVLVADADERFRDVVGRAILGHPQLRRAGMADDGHRALAMIISRQPDVALLDVGLAGIDGFEVSERVRRHQPERVTRVILVSALPDRRQLAAILQAGAVGCVARSTPNPELCRALVAAGRGEAWIPDDPTEGFVHDLEGRLARVRAAERSVRAEPNAGRDDIEEK